MRPQCFNGVKVARQFGLCEGGVDLIVTNLMQAYDRASLAALQLGHQMMQALAHMRGDWPSAQGANGVTVCV